MLLNFNLLKNIIYIHPDFEHNLRTLPLNDIVFLRSSLKIKTEPIIVKSYHFIRILAQERAQ